MDEEKINVEDILEEIEQPDPINDEPIAEIVLSVSYVLPVYNGQVNIASTINSLLKQTVPGQIIVINDSSTDNTANILKTYKDEIIVVSFLTRRGAAVARNIGNKIADGDIIAVCDADEYEPDRGESIVKFFTEKPDFDVFSTGVRCRSSINPNHIWDQPAHIWDGNTKCPIAHPTVAYRRKVALESPYLEVSKDTDLYEFFLLKLLREGKKFGICSNLMMTKTEGDTVRNKSKAWALKKEYYKKFGIDLGVLEKKEIQDR